MRGLGAGFMTASDFSAALARFYYSAQLNVNFAVASKFLGKFYRAALKRLEISPFVANIKQDKISLSFHLWIVKLRKI